MIRVNGIPLDNPELGWLFRPGSVPYANVEAELGQLTVAGRDGVVSTATTLRSPLYPLKINTPPSGWAPLLALFTAPKLVLTRDDVPNVDISVRLVSGGPDRIFDRNALIDATFIVELTGAFWRDKAATTTSVPLGEPSVSADLFVGVSAPVADAVLRIRGQASGIQITDSSGAWITLPNVAADSYLRFESATGRAYVTTTEVWTGGTDVSGLVDFGGPRGVFEITPVLDVSDPTSRLARLTVSTTTRSNASLDVRGKAAYIL